MHFFLRIFVLPMLFTLSLQAPAHAQAQASNQDYHQPQTLQMTSIHDVSLGMSLDDGISALREAGFVFKTTETGDLLLQEQRASHYEGTPVYFRAATASLESDGVLIQLMALRAPDAPENDWAIAAIARMQDFASAEIKPLYKDLVSQIDARVGADEATCYTSPDKQEYVYIFAKDGAFVAGDGDGEFCENVQHSFQNGDFSTAVMINMRSPEEHKDRVSQIGISLLDSKLSGLRKAIAEGTYGKIAPTIGDF